MNAPSGPAGLGPLARLQFLLRDSVLYGGATAASRLTTLVTFPVLLRHLSVIEYGALDFFQMLGAFLVILFVFGQESAVSRYFFEWEDETTRRQLISQSLFFRLGVAAVALPIAWYLAPRLIGFDWGDVDPVYLFRISLIHVPFVILLNFAISILRITFSRYLFVALTVGFSFFQAALWLISLLVFDLGVEGVMYASIVSAGVFGFVGLYLVRSWLVIPGNFRIVWDILPYALPYGAVICLEAANPLLERSLVKSLLDAEALGLYAAAAKVAMLFNILAYAFQVAWNPFALAIHKSDDAGQTYDQVFRLMTLAVCLVALMLGAISAPLVLLFGSERFLPAAPIVFPLIMAQAIIMLTWIVEVGINLSKRTQFKLFANLAGAVSGLVFIFFLVRAFGITGAPFGVLLGSVVKLAATMYFSQRLYRIPWSTGPVALLLGTTIVFGTAGTLLAQGNGATWMTALCGAGSASVVILAGGFVFSRDERRAVLARAGAHLKAWSQRS